VNHLLLPHLLLCDISLEESEFEPQLMIASSYEVLVQVCFQAGLALMLNLKVLTATPA
jgi:hypothetical protein